MNLNEFINDSKTNRNWSIKDIKILKIYQSKSKDDKVFVSCLNEECI